MWGCIKLRMKSEISIPCPKHQQACGTGLLVMVSWDADDLISVCGYKSILQVKYSY